MEKILVPISEAMKISGLSRSGLYERLADGSIQAKKAGRKTLILVESLQNWAASLPVAAFKAAVQKGGK